MYAPLKSSPRAIFGAKAPQLVVHVPDIIRTMGTGVHEIGRIILVHDAHRDVGKVFPVCRQLRTVCHQLNVVRLASRTHYLFVRRLSGCIVSHYFQLARLVWHIHPHQPIPALEPKRILALQGLAFFARQLALLPIALAVHEQFRFGITGVDKYRRVFAFPALPVPVRQHVQGR